ncbi:hypothetical protein ABZ820_22060 [Streptomyces diacarni]|uniref:hypothetical protein n=1 Tax=Streptomyces diacarni TaxID=2800381 RepID=UPI0033F752B2
MDFEDAARRLDALPIAPPRPDGVHEGEVWQVPVGRILLSQRSAPEPPWADTPEPDEPPQPLVCPECNTDREMYVTGAWDTPATVRCALCGHAWAPVTGRRAVLLTNLAISTAVREQGLPGNA